MNVLVIMFLIYGDARLIEVATTHTHLRRLDNEEQCRAAAASINRLPTAYIMRMRADCAAAPREDAP